MVGETRLTGNTALLLFRESWNLEKYTRIGYPVCDVAVVAGETAVEVSPGVEVAVCSRADVGVAGELVAVGVGVFVEPDPQAERARKIKRSKVPMIAFKSVTRRNECVIGIGAECECVIQVVLSSHRQRIDLLIPCRRNRYNNIYGFTLTISSYAPVLLAQSSHNECGHPLQMTSMELSEDLPVVFSNEFRGEETEQRHDGNGECQPIETCIKWNAKHSTCKGKDCTHNSFIEQIRKEQEEE